MAPLEAFAPAKINLFLHVGPLGVDRYHPICSLMVFADIGDRLVLTPGDGPALLIGGQFAAGLDNSAGNLVTRARAAILSCYAADAPRFTISLTKRLPVAAGLGGGSSDAAAALALIDQALGMHLGQAALIDLALKLGSDVPACVAGRPVIAEGRGDRLQAAPAMPILSAVLVNPGVASPTAEVFRDFDDTRVSAVADLPSLPEAFTSTAQMVSFLTGCRNDLQAPAQARRSIIGEVLALLEAQPQTLIARLSGSGATCFALCNDLAAANALADRLRVLAPRWWIAPCRLGGPWTRTGTA